MKAIALRTLLIITLVGLVSGGVCGAVIQLSFSVLVYFIAAAFVVLLFHARVGTEIRHLHLPQRLKNCILYTWLWMSLSLFVYCLIQGIFLHYFNVITLSLSSFGLLISALFAWETLMRANNETQST